MKGPPLVLASASPRRADLLTRLGLSFQVVPSHIAEDAQEGETPEDHAERLAREKVLEVRNNHPESLVLAGDTVVVLGGEVLGKPRDAEDAVDMLLSLAGRTHTVVSGLALAFPHETILSGRASTEVTFRFFDKSQARRYVATGEPMDKAGSYGIQGMGSALVQEIRGDYHNVVGLPLPLLLDLLREGGIRYEFGALLPFHFPESEAGTPENTGHPPPPF